MSKTNPSKFIIEHGGLNDVQADIVSIKHGGAHNIKAKDVSITMGGANEVTAETATLRQGGAQEIKAEEVVIRQGGAAQVTTNTLTLNQGGIAFAQTKTATSTASSLGVMIASGDVVLDQSVARGMLVQGGAEIDQSMIGAIITRQATVNNGAVMFLIAGKVKGDVQPLLGPQTAMLFGAAFGAAFGFVMWLRKRLTKT